MRHSHPHPTPRQVHTVAVAPLSWAQRGMTLVELMVAIAIGLFLSLVLYAAYMNSSRLFSLQDHLAEMQDSGRAAIEVLQRESRLIGYLGCVNESSLATPPFTSLMGYESASSVVPAISSTEFSGVTGHALVIRHGAYKSLPLTATMTSNTSMTAGSDEFGWKGTTPTMLISDCVGAEQFTASAITAAGTTTTLSSGSPLGRLYTATARVRPVETSIFFLATPTGKSQPSLYQRLSNGYVNVDLRVADNVAEWKLSYATGTEDSKLSASGRKASDLAAAEWKNVKSIRVDLLLISRKPTLDEPAGYWFDFANVTSKTDRYLRKEMATTIAVRNRITGIQ